VFNKVKDIFKPYCKEAAKCVQLSHHAKRGWVYNRRASESKLKGKRLVV
jgi:hypothetical protein